MDKQIPEITDLGEAEYLLETPLKCPNCGELITTIHVVRLLRTRVNFISSLPRRGHAVACSTCQGIITVSLGGMP